MNRSARTRAGIALFGGVATLLSLASCGSAALGSSASFEVQLDADLSADRGPATGTLFQVGTGTGVEIGAGITFADNSAQVASATVVTFFARSEQRDVTVRDLGTPFTESAPFHLVVLDGRLVAFPYNERGLLPMYYDEDRATWTEFPSADPNRDDLRPVLMDIAGETLEVVGDDVWYAGARISDGIDWDGATLVSAFYADGLLYFAVDYPWHAPVESGYRVCTWTPGAQLRSCADHRLGTSFWSYAAVPDARTGSLTVFGSKGEILKVSQEHGIEQVADPGTVSNQIYSSVRFNDASLLGHYPSGSLTSYDGQSVDHFIDPPIPVQQCSSPNYREAQTVALWGGELAVGVWSWGEVWTGIPGEQWSLAARGFSQPEPCGEAPYQDVLISHPAHEYNALGQRIFGMASWSTGLAVATSSKNEPTSGALSLITAEQRAEYGRVLLLERDAEISCQLASVAGSRLTFRLDSDAMEVIQDGRQICSRSVNTAELVPITGDVVVGSGAWGPFEADLTAVT